MAVKDSSEFTRLYEITSLLVKGIGPLVEHDTEDLSRFTCHLIHLLHGIRIDSSRFLAQVVQPVLEGIDSVDRMPVVGACRNDGIDKAAVHQLLGGTEISHSVTGKGPCLVQFCRIDVRYRSESGVGNLVRKKSRGVLVPHVSETDDAYPYLVHVILPALCQASHYLQRLD